MPTPQQLAAVYDFEAVFENALKAVLTAAEVKAFTSQLIPSTGDAAEDATLAAQGFEILDFQKDRPRVEIFFTPGAGMGQLIQHPETGAETETAWKGGYALRLITAADMRIHRAFRTLVRYQCHRLRGVVNGVAPMTLHCLQFLRDAGTSPTIKSEDGLFESALQFEIDFSIQGNAWAQLAT